MSTDPMAEIRASFFVECEELMESLQDALVILDEDGDGLTIAEQRRRAAQQASAAPSSTAGAHGNASVGSTAATARPDSEETQR